MMPRIIELLYDCFYQAPKPAAETEERRAALATLLDERGRKLLLQLVDAKDDHTDTVSLDSFVAGFQLAWQLSAELNHYKNERLVSHFAKRPGARFILSKEDVS